MKRMLSAIALLLAAAGSAAGVEPKPAPYTIKTGSPIACDATPFGRFIELGLDQEVLVTRIVGTTPSLYQLSGGPIQPERELLGGSGSLAAGQRVVTTAADIDGDGDEEQIVVVYRSDFVQVATFGRSASAGNALVEIDNWRMTAFNTTARDLQVTTADLLGRRNGSRQIVLGWIDSSDRFRVVALDAAPGGGIAHDDQGTLINYIATVSPAFGTNFSGVDALRIAGGNPLLERAEQVMLVTRRQTGGETRLGYSVLRAGTFEGELTFVDFPGSYAEEAFSAPGDLEDFSVQVADFGGSAAHEVLVSTQSSENGSLNPPRLRLRWYATTRDAGNSVQGATLSGAALNYQPNISGQRFAVAVGEVDRLPGKEIAFLRPFTGGGQAVIRTELLDVGFSTAGVPVSFGPDARGVVADVPANPTGRLRAAIGDADGDSIGDVYFAFQDAANFGTRLRRLAMTPPPSADALADTASFSLRASYDFPTSFAATGNIELRLADIDQDSTVATVSATCRRVREPLVRSVVKLPPYWERLQGGASEALATIGRTTSAGATVEQRFGTFSSHDVSGYFGAQVGSETLGFKFSAKVKAGGNWQSSRTELRGSEQTTTLTESQSQSVGEGLVVVEENLFDCYSYEVLRGGQALPASTLRACEIVRTGDGGSNPRTMVALDLETWDTATAGAPGGGATPAQWKPLHPDWANLALFRPTSTRPPAQLQQPNVPTAITDGDFSSGWNSRIFGETFPYAQIDLGEVRDISNIRVWPSRRLTNLLGVNTFRDVRIYVSETPILGDAVPTGMANFTPDPGTGNGVDRWNVWTRDPATGAPLRGRFVRIQSLGGGGQDALEIAEVQVFGDVHREPVDYPDAVCDPVAHDGTFLAVVADTVSVPNRWRTIQMRGDLLWTGVANREDPRCGVSPSLHAGVRSAGIWELVSFAGTGTNAWALEQASSNLVGSTTSLSHSARVGAEIEAELGLVVGAIAGVAYEFASGATEEQSTTMYWGQSLQYAGAMRSISNPSASNCDYRPQPYSYAVTDRSNVGYTHRYTVVDYVVRGLGWSRIGGAPPASNCFPARPNAIFASGFEAAAP
ncbi:MAG: discoidin domain-containing protein [Xanthomonadales bacterium]|nr:discoidin domain-containing protein [Xanthomonadales bacterium]